MMLQGVQQQCINQSDLSFISKKKQKQGISCVIKLLFVNCFDSNVSIISINKSKFVLSIFKKAKRSTRLWCPKNFRCFRHLEVIDFLNSCLNRTHNQTNKQIKSKSILQQTIPNIYVFPWFKPRLAQLQLSSNRK